MCDVVVEARGTVSTVFVIGITLLRSSAVARLRFSGLREARGSARDELGLDPLDRLVGAGGGEERQRREPRQVELGEALLREPRGYDGEGDERGGDRVLLERVHAREHELEGGEGGRRVRARARVRALRVGGSGEGARARRHMGTEARAKAGNVCAL